MELASFDSMGTLNPHFLACSKLSNWVLTDKLFPFKLYNKHTNGHFHVDLNASISNLITIHATQLWHLYNLQECIHGVWCCHLANQVKLDIISAPKGARTPWKFFSRKPNHPIRQIHLHSCSIGSLPLFVVTVVFYPPAASQTHK